MVLIRPDFVGFNCSRREVAWDAPCVLSSTWRAGNPEDGCLRSHGGDSCCKGEAAEERAREVATCEEVQQERGLCYASAWLRHRGAGWVARGDAAPALP
ncbi:hypothetical protein E2C01_028085 [Portunus trituberculatus]|uniref:Uncharacterized protein n=1 Tax=Portunus trituberculatus TaxID=210409 RepID=A0A5B7EN98_PORTR|nr:hypothetical protein [Portunus trituberculatus]